MVITHQGVAGKRALQGVTPKLRCPLFAAAQWGHVGGTILAMSAGERERLAVIRRVAGRELRQKRGGELLKLGARQMKRLTAVDRRRRPAVAQGEIVHPASEPNDAWAIDFKGWFRTRDGTRCDPLTVTDAASRYLLQVCVVNQTSADVRCALERWFNEVGLPHALRSEYQRHIDRPD